MRVQGSRGSEVEGSAYEVPLTGIGLELLVGVPLLLEVELFFFLAFVWGATVQRRWLQSFFQKYSVRLRGQDFGLKASQKVLAEFFGFRFEASRSGVSILGSWVCGRGFRV